MFEKSLCSLPRKNTEFKLTTNCKYTFKSLYVLIKWLNPFFLIFSSPGPKGQVSFSHHLASGVRHCLASLLFTKIFSSETTESNLTNLGHNQFLVCGLKNVSGDPVNQPRWPPWLKIDNRGKMQFLAYNSKTKALRANLIWT